MVAKVEYSCETLYSIFCFGLNCGLISEPLAGAGKIIRRGKPLVSAQIGRSHLRLGVSGKSLCSYQAWVPA